MRKITKTVLIVSIAILAFAWLQNDTKKDVSSVEVKRVIDGDTVEVSGFDESIRFLGIDTPELDGEHYPNEYQGIENNSCLVKWAEKVKNYTRKNLEQEKITLVFDSEAGEKGDYGRYLAYIELNGTDFTKSLLEQGYARLYGESDFKRKQSYFQAEEKARINDKGIWNCN